MNMPFLWPVFAVLAISLFALQFSILTIRIMQDGTTTRWSINSRNVTMTELEGENSATNP